MDDAATVRRFSYDLINAGDIDGFGTCLADDFVEHEETPGSRRSTKEGVQQFFPDRTPPCSPICIFTRRTS